MKAPLLLVCSLVVLALLIVCWLVNDRAKPSISRPHDPVAEPGAPEAVRPVELHVSERPGSLRHSVLYTPTGPPLARSADDVKAKVSTSALQRLAQTPSATPDLANLLHDTVQTAARRAVRESELRSQRMARSREVRDAIERVGQSSRSQQ